MRAAKSDWPAWKIIGGRRYWLTVDGISRNRKTALFNARAIRLEDRIMARVVKHPKKAEYAVYYCR